MPTGISQTNRNMTVAIAVVIIIVLASVGFWYFFVAGLIVSSTPEPVTVGTPHFEGAGLFYIAEDQGFFARNGLNVTEKNYDSGSAAVNGLTEGEVDIGLSSEYVLVTKAFNYSTIQALGSIDKGEYTYVVGRKDRGIENISDLKGKKIGFTEGTISEFYLGRLLNIEGLSMQDVIPVNITRSDSVDEIVNGSVDAVVTNPPYITAITDLLGNNAIVLPAQNNRYTYEIVIGNNDWIMKKPRLVSSFLKSLAMANDYVVTHPDDAEAILQKRMNYSDEDTDMAWDNNHFTLSLDQSLLVAMNDEGTWMIANNLTAEKTLPDFSNFIDTTDLEKIKPESVDIR